MRVAVAELSVRNCPEVIVVLLSDPDRCASSQWDREASEMGNSWRNKAGECCCSYIVSAPGKASADENLIMACCFVSQAFKVFSGL